MNRKVYKVHPEIKRLFTFVGKILSLARVGSGATDSFWQERSLDCHFLEFGEVFEHEREPRVRVQFYPGQAEHIDGINYVEVLCPEAIWTVTPSMWGEIRYVSRTWPRFERHWCVRKFGDADAHLSWLSISDKNGGSVFYGSFYPQSDKWSRGVSIGYPLPGDAKTLPCTLKSSRGVRRRILGRPVIANVNIKEKIDGVILLGRFERFLSELESKARGPDCKP